MHYVDNFLTGVVQNLLELHKVLKIFEHFSKCSINNARNAEHTALLMCVSSSQHDYLL